MPCNLDKGVSSLEGGELLRRVMYRGGPFHEGHEKSSGLSGFSGFFIFQIKHFPLDVMLFIDIWGADIPFTPTNSAYVP